MKLDRISATPAPRSVLSRADQSLPAPGQSVLLTYKSAEGGDLLATLANGMALRLSGPALWRGDLQPGDILRAKVLGTDGGLQLELEDTLFNGAAERAAASDSDVATMTRHTAMRMDQAVLRQMAWQIPSAAALALSWQALALQRWTGRLTDREAITQGTSAKATNMLGPAPFREPASSWLPPGLNHWLFPVYAWGGVQMLLGRGASDDAKASGQRRRNLVLRLELAPVALGRVVLQVQWNEGGIQLEIVVEHADAAIAARDALPGIATALSLAGLRLTAFRLTQGTAAISGIRDTRPESRSQPAAPPSLLALFRALAETAVVLLQAEPDLSASEPLSAE
ncbi:MAG: flagellar hook-length control protein FliK [Steroidobacteraceae bacterium]